MTTEFYDLDNNYQLHPSGRFFYKTYPAGMQYDSADTFCSGSTNFAFTAKAYLPLPLSDEENKLISEIMPGKNIWLALSSYTDSKWQGPLANGYTSYTTYRTPENTIGEKITYTNWRNGDPVPRQVAAGEYGNAVIMSGSDGKWEMVEATEYHHVVCIFRI